MPIGFPSSPTIGQQWPTVSPIWQWDGVKWVSIAGTGGAGGGGGGTAEDPITLTGNTTLAWPAAQGKYHYVNSPTAVALTLPSGAIDDASKIIGMNVGAGALSFVASGGETIVQHAILPATVDQHSPFELRRFGAVWERVA